MRGGVRPDTKFLAKITSFNATRFQSGPKSLAIFTALNARRFSVRTEAPGGFFQFKCEALFGQGQNPRQYLPVEMRGAFGSEPDFLAIFPRVAAGHFSCEAFV